MRKTKVTVSLEKEHGTPIGYSTLIDRPGLHPKSNTT